LVFIRISLCFEQITEYNGQYMMMKMLKYKLRTVSVQNLRRSIRCLVLLRHIVDLIEIVYSSLCFFYCKYSL